MRTIARGILVFCLVLFIGGAAMAAYHHEGEVDSARFLSVYPEKAGTKLDHCATCHAGGEYENSRGRLVAMGSCQWCHYSYGYDGQGQGGVYTIIDTLNAYGLDYLTNGRDADAVAAIATTDSDGDGYANAEEIAADRFPGNADDDPSKVPAPSKEYTRAELEAMTQHTQFMLMNTSRSGDHYSRYTGVPLRELLDDAGILDTATGVTVFAPDGWSQYHPLHYDDDMELYHVYGTMPDADYQYPPATFYYDPEAEEWCDYSSPFAAGRTHGNPIQVDGGLKAILALQHDGAPLEPGVLDDENRLDGEGPYRVVVPQKNPTPPDQSSKSDNQNVIWPYHEEWDHNAGACTRSTTIIRVEPLPEGTTDIDLLESGWQYIDQEKIIIYGAIAESTDDDGDDDGGTDDGDDGGDGGDCFIGAAGGASGPWALLLLALLSVLAIRVGGRR